MKIKRYISVLGVLVVGLFLVNVSLPVATFAEDQTPTCPNYLQCYAPGNTWCAPATSAAAVPEPAAKAPASTVKRSETPWEVVGSILAVPFVIGQCVFAGCP